MIALPNPKAEVDDFIRSVQEGQIVVGRLVRLAVERHVHDLQHAHARGWKFDEDIATRAVLFFPLCCRHSIGEWDGEPLELAPWQKFIVWTIFGWRNIQTGFRRFRKAYISVARKAGKTTVAAAIGLLTMFFDEPFEPGAEIYCAATKEDQAKILHKEAVRMVKASPALSRRAKCRKAPHSIEWEERNSFFRPLGSDSDGMDGLNPHVVILDELHAWREHHRDLKEKLETGSGARRQALEVIITTAGDDRSQLWIEEDDAAGRVVESVETGNVVDDTLFVFIARIDPGDDPMDESVWVKANPNLGVSVKVDEIRRIANEARYRPTELNKFLRYYCNIRVGSTERAISTEMWAKGEHALTIDDSLPLDEATGTRRRIGPAPAGYGGIDIGRSNDWCAIGVCFPIRREKESDEDDGIDHWEIKAKAWTCKSGEFQVDQEPFRTWIRNGLLECCDGDQVDFAAVRREIAAWSDWYDIRNWAFDPNFATAFAQNVQEEIGVEVYKFFQNSRMYNEPVRRFLKELQAGRIWHGNEPVLGWQAGNLVIRRNAVDEWMPDKGKSQYKIDGMIAVLMSFAGCIAHADTSVQGPLFIY